MLVDCGPIIIRTNKLKTQSHISASKFWKFNAEISTIERSLIDKTKKKSCDVVARGYTTRLDRLRSQPLWITNDYHKLVITTITSNLTIGELIFWFYFIFSGLLVIGNWCAVVALQLPSRYFPRWIFVKHRAQFPRKWWIQLVVQTWELVGKGLVAASKLFPFSTWVIAYMLYRPIVAYIYIYT